MQKKFFAPKSIFQQSNPKLSSRCSVLLKKILYFISKILISKSEEKYCQTQRQYCWILKTLCSMLFRGKRFRVFRINPVPLKVILWILLFFALVFLFYENWSTPLLPFQSSLIFENGMYVWIYCSMMFRLLFIIVVNKYFMCYGSICKMKQ